MDKKWWSGDERVEKYMRSVHEAIRRHLEYPSEGAVDIYNRAYEAVFQAIKDCENGLIESDYEKSKRNTTEVEYRRQHEGNFESESED